VLVASSGSQMIPSQLALMSEQRKCDCGGETDLVFMQELPTNVYAATSLFCKTKASNSALIRSLCVEHIPWGASGITFSVAPLTSFAESSAESAMGTI
jgi:hypothetical protein